MSKTPAAPAPVWTIPKRGPVGGQWWTEAFLAVCDSTLDRGRMIRGATYARAGNVKSVEVGHGYVDAQVKGSRRKPYETSLIWQPWSGEPLRRLEHSLAQHRAVLAALLTGELPQAFDGLVQAAGLSLMPIAVGQSRYARQLDIDFDCSCPDYGYPCKHGAALLLAFLHRTNAEPRLLLTLRGLAPEQVALAGPSRQAPAMPTGRFYQAGDGLRSLSLAVTRPANPAAILGGLGPLTLQVGRQSATTALIAAYDILSASAVVCNRDLIGQSDALD